MKNVVHLQQISPIVALVVFSPKFNKKFFPNSSISCSCGKANIQTCEYIVIECDLYSLSTRPCNNYYQ